MGIAVLPEAGKATSKPGRKLVEMNWDPITRIVGKPRNLYQNRL